MYTSHTSDYILMIFPYLLVRSHMFFAKTTFPLRYPHMCWVNPHESPKKKNIKSHKSPHRSPFREGFNISIRISLPLSKEV